MSSYNLENENETTVNSAIIIVLSTTYMEFGKICIDLTG